ncbi:homeobox-leucine zipper protein HAT22-like isoform X2 [Bidens hawaiensis]|uniref:homeobox-leucine zipper protein HAT22-like isoform X2 n=1 Tax=Bidens hawaiensis TaxID=980011 RepID=UPI0040495CE6
MEFTVTGLVLGLSLNSSPSSPSMVKLNTMNMANFEPSLTLGLSRNDGDHRRRVVGCDIGILYHQYSSVVSGGGSSSSHTSSKREREVASEESERVMSATSVDDHDVEDDYDCANGRKKLRLTKTQSALLEQAFKHHSSLNPKQKQELARELKLWPRQVEVWFQNRRARTKLKQTKLNFEHMKKCCEKLTDENRRLQKELQELKAITSSQPFYMQLPAATLTMCPSCERIGDAKSSVLKNPFAMAAKPQFFNSFTNPTTAC